MGEFLRNLGETSWWVSVVGVGLLISVVGNILTRRLDGAKASAFKWLRERSAKRRAKFDAEVQLLRAHPNLLPHFLQQELRFRFEAVGALVYALIVVCIAAFFVSSYAPSWLLYIRPAAIPILSLLFVFFMLLSQLFEGRAARTQDVANAVLLPKDAGEPS